MKMNNFKKSLLAVLMGMLLAHSIIASAAVEKLSISQIVQKGNDVYLYVSMLDGSSKPSGDAASAEQFSVNIDKKQDLSVKDAAAFSSLNQGVSYIFCIDISKSVTEEEMQEIRSSLSNFINGMTDKDYARIITIGTEVKSICDSTNDKNALNTAAQTIARTADFTYLYKGLSFALDGQRKNVDTMPERAAVVVFTDGMDDSDGASGEEQVLVDIAETRIPIYVVGVRGKDPEANLNSVGQIARQSGGSVFSYSEMSITDAVQNVKAIMQSTYLLHVQPEKESFGTQNLVWTAAYHSDGYSVSSTNYVYSLGMENVSFEPVTEAPPETEPAEESEPVPILPPETEPEPEESFMDKLSGFLADNWIICVIAAVAIAGAIVGVVLFLRKKKNDESDFEMISPEPSSDRQKRHIGPYNDETIEDSSDDDEGTIGDDFGYDDDDTIDERNVSGIALSFEITFDGRTETVEQTLEDELILGRGTECDVDVVLQSRKEERKMVSRKHASILNRPDGLYVKDNSRNKTYLNGVEVMGEVVLRDEDVLQMGKSIVKVRILNMRR